MENSSTHDPGNYLVSIVQTSFKPADESIEGIGEGEDAYWDDYPIDTLLIRNETRTVYDVLRRIEKGAFIINPDFQRDFIWTEDKQSKLIESVLMRIPLPVFYLAEDEKGRNIVVDGLQRLSTFQRFIKNELQLKLPHQVGLDKKTFKILSPKLQNRIEDCNLILYIIDAKVPERTRLDIFERVNSGVPLSRQQMRNCIYMGQATKFLKNEANTELFLQATGQSLQISTMRDRECINRFCAFQLLALEDYKGDMDGFLGKCLKKMNELPHDQLEKLSSQFRTSLKNNLTAFGKHAFRKYTDPQQDRSVFNASLWDVMSTGLSHYSESTVNARTDVLRTAFFSLLTDENFNSAITMGTNQVKKVKYRFQAANKMFHEVFGA